MHSVLRKRENYKARISETNEVYRQGGFKRLQMRENWIVKEV